MLQWDFTDEIIKILKAGLVLFIQTNFWSKVVLKEIMPIWSRSRNRSISTMVLSFRLKFTLKGIHREEESKKIFSLDLSYPKLMTTSQVERPEISLERISSTTDPDFRAVLVLLAQPEVVHFPHLK